MWHELHKRCSHLKSPHKGYRFVPKPTPALLDRFEATRGSPLPSSYREFVALFGPGELAEFYRIAAPLPFAHDRDLESFDRMLHGEPEEQLLASHGPSEVTDRVLFFANNGGDDFFGWKNDELTDTPRNEYAVYRFAFGPMERVADTFEQWVRDYVLKADPVRQWTPTETFARFQVEC